MKNLTINQQNLINLIHNYKGNSFLSTIKIMHLVFDNQNNKVLNSNYQFVRWDFGPYSLEIKRDLDILDYYNYVRKVSKEVTHHFVPLKNPSYKKLTIKNDSLSFKELSHYINNTYDIESYSRNEIIS